MLFGRPYIEHLKVEHLVICQCIECIHEGRVVTILHNSYKPIMDPSPFTLDTYVPTPKEPPYEVEIDLDEVYKKWSYSPKEQ